MRVTRRSMPQGVIGMARGVDFIVADRATPIPALVFESLPGLRVVMRSAIDIRNIDVAAATKAGVLVTHAEAGFVPSVVELTLGFLVDLSRGITRAATAYHEGASPRSRSAVSSAAPPSASSATAASRANWRRCWPNSA